MILKELFGGKEVEVVDENQKKLIGKIIHLSEQGYGFISSPDIKFTRIFFHWTGLEQGTLNFAELKKGMKVEFIAKEFDEKGWRAIKVKVIEEDKK